MKTAMDPVMESAIPRLRKALLVAACLATAACGGLIPAAQSSTSPRASAQSVRAAAATGMARDRDTQMCLARLGQSGSQFSILPDRHDGPGCRTVNAVALAAIRGDKASFAIANTSAIECDTAQRLVGWARFGVDRAARQILGSPLARIDTMGSYSCRRVAGTRRLSAHAEAKAVDVAGFALADGRYISVRRDWSGGNAREREFLRVVLESACKRFGTVLGPEYNAAHRDHFHLESTGNRFCR